tara:strand:- start:233 stop:1228 length:996 start_codon:yes stop_codon:yes gene_type:complete
LKIGFYSSSRDITVGSYRIWCNDLCHYFIQAGIDAKIVDSLSNIEEADVIILAKNDWQWAHTLKNKYPHKTIGVTNLAAEKKNISCDFIIVGSLEEKISLSGYPNVLYFPLIENMFQNTEIKKHTTREKLTIGYHGSFTHLSKFSPYLTTALEKFEQDNSFNLKIITSLDYNGWSVGVPRIKNIEISYWNKDTILDEIMKCDIGLVPNVTSVTPDQFNGIKTSSDLGMYETDYIIRFKNKSNAGRAYVFHQTGIPVIADITPSNFHILGDERCGYVAHNTDSWLKALKILKNPDKRNQIATAAKTKFDQEYDPIVWAKRLYEEIKEISDDI